MNATINVEDVGKALKRKRALDKQLNPLVRRAQELVDNTGIATRESRLERKQLSNVLAVANETPSIEVLKNFIRYQIGRAGQEGWKVGNFGQRLVEELDVLGDMAETLAREGSGERDSLWIELARQYLGYLERWFVYRKQR